MAIIAHLPAKYGSLMPEIAHADKGNDGADQGQPLQSGGDFRVSRQAQVSCQTNDPHQGAAPESH